jgi:hypothetical protein
MAGTMIALMMVDINSHGGSGEQRTAKERRVTEGWIMLKLEV